MLGTKFTISFIGSCFLIFSISISTYGLKNVDRHLILDSGSNLFIKTTPNNSDSVNRYQIPKPLDFKNVSPALSGHFNMAAQLEISKANRDFKVQGQVHGHGPQYKQHQSNLNRRLFSKTQRKKTGTGTTENVILKDELLDEQKISGVMDRLWSALNYGSLTELHKKKTETSSPPSPPPPPPPDANYWTVIKEKVDSGVLFVEIGGCLTASSVAVDWGSSSVVVSLLLKGLYNGCISNTRESHFRNFLIGSVSHVQEMVESLSSDQAVAIEHLLLSDVQVLWQSLLPHECEDLLSKLLALSWKVYIVNPNVRIGHVVPYTDWWSNLGTFLKICCQKRNLHCTIDLLNGTNSWESLAVYQVTVESGYRPPIDINKPIINSKKQQQSVPMKPSDAYHMQDSGDRLDSQMNNRYSFSVLSKGLSLSKESLELLFLICLQMPTPEWNKMIHLSFFTLKPFHLHVYRPDPLKMPIKMETPKYTKVFKTYQTFRPRHTPDFDNLGEFWDREIVVQDPHKLGNEREVAISNAFWDRDGSFLESKLKNDELTLWNSIWNRDEFEESPRYNMGLFKSSDEFQKLAWDFPLHKSKRSFQRRSFHDNLPDLEKGISGTRQRSFTTIQRHVFSKMPFFQNVQKVPSFSFLGKINLNNKRQKLIIPAQKAKLKNLYLSLKLNDIHTNSVFNKVNMRPKFPYVKNKIVLNKINPNISKMIQQPKVHRKDLRNSIWNNDFFKWILPRFHQVQLDVRLPIHKLVKYVSIKKTKFIENKDKIVKKATTPHKMSWNYRKSKLGRPRIKNEFYVDQSREELITDYGIRNSFQDLLKRKGTKIIPENNQARKNKQMEGIDERIYQSQWNAVKLFFKQRLDGNFSLLVYGTKHLTLLAAKTGLLYPHSTILNIVPTFDAAFADMYKHILPPNVLTAFNNLDKQIVNTISHLPNLFTFQILGMDIFAKILCLHEGFIEYLGNILSLAQVSIFIVPKQERLLFVQIILGNINGTGERNDFSFKKLILKAAAMIKAELNMKVIKADDVGGSLLFVELKHLKKEVIFDCSHGKGILIFEDVSPVTAYVLTDKSLISFDTRTIVLSFLLALDLRASERRQLFLHYLHLPIYQDMCPRLIFWSVQGLSHSHQHTQTEENNEHFPSDSSLKLLVRIFTKELIESSMPFSFLEYQSEGSLISQLAGIFPNSTFIAVMQNHQTVTSFHQKANANNLENLLVTQHAVDDILTQKLLRSPEFFRYQFMGYKCFLNLASTLSRKKFNLMMGQLLSVSVSSFLMLPSEKSLSLAMLTFYPEFHSNQWSEGDHNSEKNDYLSDNHPLRFYKNAERKIIFESARADIHAEVEAITSQHFRLREGNLFPWRLLRVNVKNLTTQVEHHFESHLDGHTRTYVQRCTSFGSRHYEVHLQRQSDGLIIPYGNVHAITLIALFRMGLLAEMQKKLYHQFLKLPLYEDMAPWNIAGQLEYIDFDTRNKTFDSVVPMAYQIMSMLMNYERTIKDFGKCKGQAKTQFGFGFISSCVGSDFLGPCKDSLKPVPCGDYTCRSTYVECLQALAKAEETKIK